MITEKREIEVTVRHEAAMLASRHCLTDPGDISEDHVRGAYAIMDTVCDKAALERHTDRFKVRKAIADAIESYCTSEEVEVS